jgi:two-component system, LytTR family, sensor kinase
MKLSLVQHLLLILLSAAFLALAVFLLSRFGRLFTSIRNNWLRKNLATLTVATFIMLAFSVELFANAKPSALLITIGKYMLQSTIVVLFVFNITWIVIHLRPMKRLSFIKFHAIVIVTILLSAFLIFTTVYYLDSGMKDVNLHQILQRCFYNAFATGLIYTSVNYVELDRKRKLNEKELEVTQLMALKTKAELDALHSKVNPHFLYNALNSIADLSITDGRKARKMTIALADLFRYSINYSQNNFSTVNDEVAMTEVYLQIEKIRFEDQLSYSVKVNEEAGHYLVPRFILQPLVENAVKHGLKITGKMTEISLDVAKDDNGLLITIADNGPEFPQELSPGYGVKSVYDKLDLLFPGQYEIHFRNQPRKEVFIQINKLMKNEPGI